MASLEYRHQSLDMQSQPAGGIPEPPGAEKHDFTQGRSESGVGAGSHCVEEGSGDIVAGWQYQFRHCGKVNAGQFNGWIMLG
ncbi:hypothetical protein [Microbulbifer sp. 2205BS26-8]|uniref:hypothetical protein n=1 Tax=Microbulbifer sp. 2205BS26-8 TaxID=3064386 RepID=UPI00273D1B6B|nr:hypothetical protein [Microbulbifer sp. 2205BS26-8]MDP5209383.1 hypothetical protein [Microbulbifer sp. 2205BS26-8]